MSASTTDQITENFLQETGQYCRQAWPLGQRPLVLVGAGSTSISVDCRRVSWPITQLGDIAGNWMMDYQCFFLPSSSARAACNSLRLSGSTSG